MALWVCLSCTTKYAVGLFACPRCRGTEFAEDCEETMAKITKHGGPSDINAEPGQPGYTPPPEPKSEAKKGGEQPSRGNSSSTSSPKLATSAGPRQTPRQSRARTTGSRSTLGPTDSSFAGSTDSGTETS